MTTSPLNIRPPAVAGSFYPADPRELRADVRALLATVPVAPDDCPPKAIIAPHAGYVYSGPTAAAAWARLAPARSRICRVVLLGPAHTATFAGLALSSAAGFATPLGVVPLDTGALAALHGLPQVITLDRAHAREHALEVQLPFLQCVLDPCTIVPLVVGEASDEEVAAVLDRLWGGPETVIVISSDLSHYLTYEAARHLDTRTAHAIEQLRPEDIAGDQACGQVPIRGLLRAAQRHGLHARTLDLRTSGDTAGPRREVVGYGAWGLWGEPA